jgi:hypothetical protein
LGDNDLQIALYDLTTGGCRDGLHPDRANENQGAESTLSFRHGDVQDVVFPRGYTIATDGDTINLYYGAADSSIALAHGSIRALLNWLDANGHSKINHDRRHT